MQVIASYENEFYIYLDTTTAKLLLEIFNLAPLVVSLGMLI